MDGISMGIEIDAGDTLTPRWILMVGRSSDRVYVGLMSHSTKVICGIDKTIVSTTHPL
jgi:hypothetical protein